MGDLVYKNTLTVLISLLAFYLVGGLLVFIFNSKVIEWIDNVLSSLWTWNLWTL